MWHDIGMTLDGAVANRRVVQTYLESCMGEALLHRSELFCEDGISGLWTSDSGDPVFVQGREEIARYDRWSARHFPQWRRYDIRVWMTDDPNHLWAEREGEGTIALPEHEPVHYANHFLYSLFRALAWDAWRLPLRAARIGGLR